MASQRTYRVQVFRGKDLLWRYRLRAPNGQIMQSGETYKTFANAKRAGERFSSLLAVPNTVEVLPFLTDPTL